MSDLSTRQIAFFTGMLILIGAGWGITMPLTKIAVSTGHGHYGLIFWQVALGSVLMAVISGLRGKWLRFDASALRVYTLIALIGTTIPNTASYQAAVHLPSGVMSILLSMIPMMAFPIALGLGLDRFSLRRFGGLFTGLAGVMLLVLPEASLPQAGSLFWVLVALIAGFCYACEGNIVAKWGTAGLDPIQVLFGASVVATILIGPIAVFTGQWISPIRSYAAPEYAQIASSVIHVLVYTGYVWLVGRAGPVFAVQVSFLVTGFGILWAKLLLAEQYSPYIWAAMALIFAGLLLVQPRRNAPLDSARSMGDTDPA